MIREIKFRARLPEGHKGLGINHGWRYGIIEHTLKSTGCDFLMSRFWELINSGELDIKTLGEYIGVKDVSDKEIYSGDIVKVIDNYEDVGFMAGEIREVYFSDGGFRLKPKEIKKNRGHWLEDGKDVEVIGNIYENPELIKEMK